MTCLRLPGLLLALRPSLFATEPSFDQRTDSFAAEWMRGNPSAATIAQYFSGVEPDALDRRFTPITEEYRAARVGLARRGLAELGQFDRAGFDSIQRISAASLDRRFGEVVQSEPFNDLDFVFEQVMDDYIQATR